MKKIFLSLLSVAFISGINELIINGEPMKNEFCQVNYDGNKCMVDFYSLHDKEVSITIAEECILSELIFCQYSAFSSISLIFNNSNSDTVLWFLKCYFNCSSIFIKCFPSCFVGFKSVYGVINIDNELAEDIDWHSGMHERDDEISTYNGDDEIVTGYLLINDSILIDNSQEGYSANSEFLDFMRQYMIYLSVCYHYDSDD